MCERWSGALDGPGRDVLAPARPGQRSRVASSRVQWPVVFHTVHQAMRDVCGCALDAFRDHWTGAVLDGRDSTGPLLARGSCLLNSAAEAISGRPGSGRSSSTGSGPGPSWTISSSPPPPWAVPNGGTLPSGGRARAPPTFRRA